MSLTDRIIERPRLVAAGTIVMCLLGALAIITLPRERTPRVQLSTITVKVFNPGSQPETNERQIIEPIEKLAPQLNGLRRQGGMMSEAHHGGATVKFVFSNHVAAVDAKREVESLINQVKSEFPPAAQRDPGPLVTDIAFEDWPVIQMIVAGGTEAAHRRRIGERLRVEAQKVAGVASVDFFGDFEPEIHVNVNPHLLCLRGLTFTQLAASLRHAFADASSGAVESPAGAEFQVHTTGIPPDLDALRRIPIDLHQQHAAVLEDVAEIRLAETPRASMARYGGEDAVVLLIRPQRDADLPAIADAIQSLVDDFVAAGRAEGLIITTGRSITRQINSMLFQLGSSAAWGGLTIFAVLLLFLGWRNALITVIALPLTLLATGVSLWFAKQSVLDDLAVNNMVLFGMILVTGLVVDGCIIVGENIHRHREAGMAPLAAAKRGVGEVSQSLLSAYLTTFAAFIPMFMIGGVVGEFLKVLPIVVILALCSALVIDHVVLPVLTVHFVKRGRLPGSDQCDVADQMDDHHGLPARRHLLSMLYDSVLQSTFRRRTRVLVATIVLLVAPLLAIASGGLGLTFFPESDVPVIEVHFELPLGSSIERTQAVAASIEAAVCRAVREEEWYQPSSLGIRARPVTTIGEPAALNTNLDAGQGSGPEYGMVFIELEAAENRVRSVAEIRQAIAEELPTHPDVAMRVRSPSEGPPSGARVLVRVLGLPHASLPTVADRAAEVEALLHSVPSAQDVRSDYRLRPGVRVTPLPHAAALHEQTNQQINTALAHVLSGMRIGKLDFGGSDQVHVRLQAEANHRDAISDLRNLPLLNDRGRVTSLEQVADVTRTYDANVIRHYNGRRVINIRAEVADGSRADDVKSELIALLRPELTSAERFRLLRGDSPLVTDADVMIEFGGENEARDEALKDLHIALAAAMAAMLLILLFQFDSFRQTLIVLSSVPLSLVGVVLGLIVCDIPFSISSMIGVVALSGIVVNDAIVIVEFYNRLRREGLEPESAASQAAQLRLRPIMLTTLTTIGGLLPLSLNIAGGAEFWQPLAVTIIFGLGVATLLQLVLIPFACCMFCRHPYQARGTF